jgi:hypothetical protein
MVGVWPDSSLASALTLARMRLSYVSPGVDSATGLTQPL